MTKKEKMTREEKKELKKKKKETEKERQGKIDHLLETVLERGLYREEEYSAAILIYSIEKNSATTNSLTNTIRWLTASLVVIGLATIGLIAYTTFCM